MSDDAQEPPPQLCERCWFPVRTGHSARWYEHQEVHQGRVRTLVSVVHGGAACPDPWDVAA